MPLFLWGQLLQDLRRRGLLRTRLWSECKDVAPHCLHLRWCEHDEVSRARHAHAGLGRLELVGHAVYPVRLGAGLACAFRHQRHDFADRAAAPARILAQHDFVEGDRGDLAHSSQVLIAPIAGNARHADLAAVGGTQTGQQVSQRHHARGVVGVVHDDPETVAIEDVQASGILLVGRSESGERQPHGRYLNPSAQGHCGGGQGVLDVELRQPSERRRDFPGPHQRAAAALLMNDDLAIVTIRFPHHGQAASLYVLPQERRRSLATT